MRYVSDSLRFGSGVKGLWESCRGCRFVFWIFLVLPISFVLVAEEGNVSNRAKNPGSNRRMIRTLQRNGMGILFFTVGMRRLNDQGRRRSSVLSTILNSIGYVPNPSLLRRARNTSSVYG